MEEEYFCYQCENWKYDQFIEHKYGEGTGLCDGEPKGCNRAACLRFIIRNNEENKNNEL